MGSENPEPSTPIPILHHSIFGGGTRETRFDHLASLLAAAPILEARDLHTYYGASHVLRGIDFSVRAGEAVGLLGRNGMGKTTLIRTLVGHLTPRRGEIRIHDQVMTGAAPHRIARLGVAYVPEGRGIFPNLTVRENLLMAARLAPAGRPAWNYERVLETFPRPPNAPDTAANSFPAASSKCSRLVGRS